MKPGMPVAAVDTCIRCGYDLAGLADDGVCPECALAVQRSRNRSHLLRSADQQWLVRIRRGLADTELAMTTLWVGIVALLFLVLTLHMLNVPLPGLLAQGGVDGALVLLLGVVVAALHIRGCVRLGLPTHGDDAPSVRVRMTLQACGILLPLTVGATMLQSMWIAGLWWPLRLTLLLFFQVNALAYFFALAATLEHLERRTRWWDKSLAWRHTGVRRNLYILIAIVLVVYWLPHIVPALTLPLRAGGWGLLLFGFAYVVFSSAVARVRCEVGNEALVAVALDLAQEDRDPD
jgi:hypothetical protein